MQVGAGAAAPAQAPSGNGAGDRRAAPPPPPATGPAAPAADVEATPVAAPRRRGRGRRPRRRHGTGPRGRITKARRPRREGQRRRDAPPPPPPTAAHGRERKQLKGGAAMLARYMDESRVDPDRDLVPHDHRHGDGRPPQGAQGRRPEGLLHAPHRLRDRAAPPRRTCRSWRTTSTRRDGKPHRVDDGAVNLGIAVDVEKKDGRRTLMVPGHPRRRPPELPRLQGRVRRAHRQGAREQAHRRRPRGREHLAHEPGRHRHDRLGPAADDRPGHDRRHRLDRLPGRPRRTSAT